MCSILLLLKAPYSFDILICTVHNLYICSYQLPGAHRDLAVDQLVKLLEDPGGKRAEDHCADEHGHAGADDDADGGDRADHAAAVVIDHLAARKCDQEREQVVEHRGDEAAEHVVVDGDADCGQQAPGNERAQIRDDHAAELATKFLHLYSY